MPVKKTDKIKIAKVPAKPKAVNKVVAKKLKAVKKTRAKSAPKLSMLIDSDADGLSDYQERQYGTNPYMADSDHDGLSDYEEIKIYQTDPLNPDTNANGISDGEEVRRGQNPRGQGKLKDLFIPYFGNNYQPEFLKAKRLIFYGSTALLVKFIVVFFVLLLPISAWLTPDIASQQAKKIIQLTNEVRASVGVAKLQENQLLDLAASNKAQDMITEQYFAHISPDNRSVSDWLRGVGYNYEVAGENLAMGFSDSADVVNAWSKSKTHYANMIDPQFNQVGVAMIAGQYKDYDTTFVAQMFGSRPGSGNAIPAVKNQNTAPKAIDQKNNKKQIVINNNSQSAVLGEKVNLPPLTTPSLIAPENNSASKVSETNLKIAAPGATGISLIINDQKQTGQANFIDGYYQQTAELSEGKNNLQIISQNGKEQSTSSLYTLIIDRNPPIIDTVRSNITIAEPVGQDQKVVRAVAYLSSDTAQAEINFGNYHIKLSQNDSSTDEWSGSTIIFKQQEEQIFNPVILPTLTAVDVVGNLATADINWQNVTPVKPSVLDQYFFARDFGSKYTNWIFGLSSIYYKILLALLLSVLVVNIIVKAKNKKYDFRLIIPAVFLAILLVVLITV
ncbi:MAG: CAP domain-containing protein [bacterium]